MRPELAIDYARGMQSMAGASLDAIVAMIRDELPSVWVDRYRLMCDGATNVLEIPLPAATYLFDFCSEVTDAREDRAVVAYGYSQKATKKRDASRIRGFPGSDDRGDRGHLVAHAAGGGLDMNVFHQDAYLNRGWSLEGKRYREMERYCAEHERTFFFSRLIYADATAWPSKIEFGILLPEGTLWVESFANRSGLEG